MEYANESKITPPPPASGGPNLPIVYLQAVLMWPAFFIPQVTSGKYVESASAVGGVVAAYYMFGNPLEASWTDIAYGYLLAGSIQTAGLVIGTSQSQMM